MPFHSGNLPLYDFHGNLQNDLPFLEEMGSQEYRSWGGGWHLRVLSGVVDAGKFTQRLSDPNSCKCLFRMAPMFYLLENGDVSPLFYFVFVKYHFTLSVLSYHGNQPEGCRDQPS